MAYTKKFTPEQQAEYAEKQKSDIEAMVKKIDDGVKAVFQSDKYKEYLKFASKFTDYSARNTMLINIQKPEATLVAAYGSGNSLADRLKRDKREYPFSPLFSTRQIRSLRWTSLRLMSLETSYITLTVQRKQKQLKSL